jgi:hypothetical protein
MAEKLEDDVKRKVENFLRTKGQRIEDLTEGELTALYWDTIRENIAEEERTTVTTYTPDDDGDDVTDAVKRADDEDVTYNDDGSISVKEEDIIEMVRESQNPVMSKSELIQEMTRQIINEDNKYEEEYNSEDSDYSKHLDSDSVRNMGRELYNDIKSAADEKFGGNTNFGRASAEMGRSIMKIFDFESNKREELQEEAVALIREEYPAMTEDTVDIEAEITGHPQLPGGREITKGNVQQEKGNTPPPEGYSEEDLKDEVTKRRLINGMTHGAARKGQNLFHMAGEKLNNADTSMTNDYAKVMAANDFLYWAMDRETIKGQSASGVHAGNVRIQIQEGGKPKIIAQGMTFSFLLHELVKGVMELISMHGRHENYEVHKYVTDKTDTLESEPDDIRLGTGIWEKVSGFVDINDGNHKAVFLHKLITRPASEFVDIMKGLVRGDEEKVRVIRGIADEASHELRDEEYGEAMGDYDEKTEEPTGGDYDDGFPDPDGDDEEDSIWDNHFKMGTGQSLGSDEPEEEGELDYSTMDRSELQRHMDDALENSDFELAAKIGPHMN